MPSIRFPERRLSGPLTIYLDSSDYSNLSKALTDSSSEWRPLLDRLRRLSESGLIQIIFSAIHISEITHLDDDAREFALGRARCIGLLSQGACLPFWLELQLEEVRACMVHGKHEAPIRTNGKWCPDLTELSCELGDILVSGFRSALLESSLNRAQRRQLEKKMMKNGKFTDLAAQQLQQSGRKKLLESVAKDFPLSDRFYSEDLLFKFALGKVNSNEIVEEFYVVFTDLEKFVGWTYSTQDKDRKTTKWLRDLGSDLIVKLEELRGQVALLDQPTPSVLWERLDEAADKSRLSRLKSIRGELGLGGDGRDGEWDSLYDSPLGTIPSLDAYILALKNHFRRSLQSKRKLKASDVGDVFHLSNLPYCDIFRADGDAAETGKLLAEYSGSRIVPKLAMLSSVIDEELGRRSQRD